MIQMNIPTNPKDIEKIRKMMKEISNSMARIESERSLIKETVDAVCDEFELPKKAFRKMARVYHKQNFNDEIAAQEEFAALYEGVTGTTSL